MQNIKQFLSNLSQYPGVYQMLGEKGEVLYVGKAKNLKKRLSSYFSKQAKDVKTMSLLAQIKDIDFTVTNSENEAVLLECNLIKKHRPRYNILLRDDKSYPYIFISAHSSPRIDIYRGPRKKNGLYFGPYPHGAAVRETISLLQKLFLLRTCRDTYFDARTRPCLLYQIGRCSAPCVELISKDDYAHKVKLAILFLEGKNDEVIQELQVRMEIAANSHDYELAASLRDQISRLRQIQEKQYVNVSEGNADVIGYAAHAGMVCLQLQSIRSGRVEGSRSYFPRVPAYSSKEEVLSAFLTQHYLNDRSHIESIPRFILIETGIKEYELIQNVLGELAGHKVEVVKPVRGEKKKWLEMATLSSKQALAAHFFEKTNMSERALALQQTLGLEKIPRRIECFDISHSMGEATVASCVVFDQNGPLKNDYRRYNITGITPGDDISAMHQVLGRRFKRLQKENAVLPDIALIDGGPTQLSAAKKVMETLNLPEVVLIGVSKGPGRKAGFESLHIENRAPIHLPADSKALHFIQQIRDEAHRFAIAGHRMKRDKKRRTSTLESIPGIGAKRRRDLLRYFGGIQGLAHASLDELSKVPGISRSLAEKIFAALHDTTS